MDRLFLFKDQVKVQQWGDDNDDRVWCLSTDPTDVQDDFVAFGVTLELGACFPYILFDVSNGQSSASYNP